MNNNRKDEKDELEKIEGHMKEVLTKNQKSNLQEEMEDLEKCLRKRGSTAAVFMLK